MAHHYIESGLDNIWLESGFTRHSTAYGDGVSIHDSQALHRAIGTRLTGLPIALNGAELRFLRLEMDFSQKALGSLLGVDEQAIRRWEKARSRPISGPADRLLRALYVEWVDGDESVRQIVERLANVQVDDAPIGRFVALADGWTVERQSHAV